MVLNPEPASDVIRLKEIEQVLTIQIPHQHQHQHQLQHQLPPFELLCRHSFQMRMDTPMAIYHHMSIDLTNIYTKFSR